MGGHPTGDGLIDRRTDAGRRGGRWRGRKAAVGPLLDRHDRRIPAR
jgi:hypothetical protein